MTLSNKNYFIISIIRIVIKASIISLGGFVINLNSNCFYLVIILCVSELYEFISRYLYVKKNVNKIFLGIIGLLINSVFIYFFVYILFNSQFNGFDYVTILIALSMLEAMVWGITLGFIQYIFTIGFLIGYSLYITVPSIYQLTPSLFTYYIPSLFIMVLFSYVLYVFQKGAPVSEQDYVNTEVSTMEDEFITLSADSLRTPVTVLRAFIDSYNKATRDDDPQKHTIQVLEDSIRKLSTVIENIMKINQIHRLYPSYLRESISFQDFVDKMINDFDIKIKEKLLILKVTRLVFPCNVKFNPDGIGVVISALLDNAIKFSPQGAELDIKVIKEKHRIYFYITDFGKGIPKEEFPDIFRQFHRVGSYLVTQSGTGLGIGLYLSKKILEAHRGEIFVESQVGKGSTFYFYLPL